MIMYIDIEKKKNFTQENGRMKREERDDFNIMPPLLLLLSAESS